VCRPACWESSCDQPTVRQWLNISMSTYSAYGEPSKTRKNASTVFHCVQLDGRPTLSFIGVLGCLSSWQPSRNYEERVSIGTG